jgi:hypothetical protein
LNERLKSGDVTVSHCRRWTDFEEYLIPRPRWVNERAQHYAALNLPLDVDGYLSQLNEQLKSVTARVDRQAPDNDVLRIDSEKGEFHLAALKQKEKPDAVKKTKDHLFG